MKRIKVFFFIKKHEIHEVSYYGEPVTTLTLNFDFAASSTASINTLFQRNINSQEVYITASSILTHLYFSVLSLEGNLLGSSFYLSGGNLSGGLNIKSNVFEKANGEFIVFGRHNFYTIKLNNDYTWEVSNEIEHSYPGINSVKKADNNYIITTGSGAVALLTENFTTLWSAETDINLVIGRKISDGYMVCGNDATEGIAHAIKLSNTGVITSQLSYEDKMILDIMPFGDKVLLAGNSIFMIDDIGNIIWEKNLPKNSSSAINLIQKSQFGTILMMSKERAYLLNINSTIPFDEYRTLSSNNIGGHISAWGDLDFNKGALEYPINEGTSTIFANTPIFIGQTKSGALKGFYDFYSMGDEVTGVLTAEPVTWKIYQSEIDIIQQRLAEDNDLAPYSQAMLTYPGKGNPNCIINGEVISIDEEFAPFVDINGDGIYNMFDGDYPEMKGDQMIWWASKHIDSNIETHGRWYAYDCGNHLISNTIYVDYKLINTSGGNLSSCFFGKFSDFDLGCYTDDYIGSMPNVNSIFTYNQDATDGTTGTNCDGGVQSYIDEIPIQCITFLSDEMETAMFYNHAIFSPPPAISQPNTFEETYNYLQAKYRDGTPLTYGGNGYNVGSSDFTAHVYPGNPSNPDEWSMVDENENIGDRLVIAATGAFNFNADESRTFTFAYTTHPNIPHPAPDVTPVIASIQEVIDIYDNGNAFAQVFLGQDQSISAGQSIDLNAGDDGLDYIWSTGENTAVIEVSTPGTYTVTVTDETGCQRSDEININTSTGLSTIEVSQLSIYPNPAKNGANISIQLPVSTQISMVKLFNLVGQELYSEKVNTNTQTLILKLPSQINAGIYTIQLMAVDGELLVGKMIIN